MFSKYIVVVSGDINIRNYRQLLRHIFENVDPCEDLLFCRGPLDVLDHSSDTFSFGGKAGVDATIKFTEETTGRENISKVNMPDIYNIINGFIDRSLIKNFNPSLFLDGVPILIVTVNPSEDPDVVEKVKCMFRANHSISVFNLILTIDDTVNPDDLHMIAWQVLGNSDPLRDHEYLFPSTVIIDGTIKAYRKGGFPRRWPNVVCSENETISAIDKRWESLGLGPLILSPSLKNQSLCRKGTDEIIIS
jgi:4-hydroxy-3-polyprenylbenzoate decarboxylase